MKRILVFALVLALSLMPMTAPAEIKTLENPHLINWCNIFIMLTMNEYSENPGGEYIVASGKIMYDTTSMRSNGKGIHMADGGVSEEGGSYELGIGASPEDEGMWYVSFTYTQDTDMEIIVQNTINMVYACASMSEGYTDGFGATDDERYDNILLIVQALLGSEDAIAVEVGDYVFVSKPLGNQLLITFDTLEFYDAFYKGSVKNYYVL